MSLVEQLFGVSGKTAVVTGGAKGIGAMISRTLVEAGAKVIVLARDQAAGEAFCAEVGGVDQIAFVACDLSAQSGIEEAARQVSGLTDKVDILVCNAGMFSAGPVEDTSRAQWDQELSLNLGAPFFLIQALLPLLNKASQPDDPARVICISSIAALWGRSNSGAYAYGASKAGVQHLARLLASDLTGQGINVNAIAPGYFPSDMTDGFFAAVPGLKEQVIESIPAGRLGSQGDIGGAVLYLASRAGAYVSGSVLPVEGALAQT